MWIKQCGWKEILVTYVLLVALSDCLEEESFNLTQITSSCVLVRLDERDIREETDENAMPERSYPVLNCSQIDINALKTSQLNHSEVQGFLIQMGNMTSFDIDNLGVFPNLETVEFRGNEGMEMRSTQTKQAFHRVFSLTVTENSLGKFPTDLLQSFPNLTQLTLTRNNVTSLPGDILITCPRLKYLNLAYNPLNESVVNTTWLSSAVNLKSLSLRATGWMDVSKAFKKAKYLEFLDLSDNKITRIDTKSFGKAANLRTLVMANNDISDIHFKAFKGTVNLRLIDLTENKLETLYQGTFDYSPIDELTVELWENPFICDCKLLWLFDWTTNLARYGSYPDIRLKCHNPSRNHGKKFSPVHTYQARPEGIQAQDLTCLSTDTKWTGGSNVFASTFTTTSSTTTTAPKAILTPGPSPPPVSDVFQLKVECPEQCECYASRQDYLMHFTRRPEDFDIWFPLLRCMGSKHTSIPNQARQDLSGVVMSNGILDQLDLSSISKFRSLRSISCPDNKIRSLLPAKDVVFDDVTVVSLEGNLITSVSREFLSSFPKLKKLRIFNNQIKTFPDDLFLQNPALSKVFLGPNPVSGFEGKCLQNSTVLVNVGLRGMGLHSVPDFIKNKVYLVKVDLSDNYVIKLHHDDFMNASSITEISLENNNISFIEENVFKQLPNLEHVDLSENFFTKLPQGLFSVNKYLSHVELWQNPIQCDCHIHWFVVWIKQMKHHDPATEIRFRCEGPMRMRGKTSDQTQPSDYTCSDGDSHSENAEPTTVTGGNGLYTTRDLVIAVALTLLCTLICLFVIRFISVRFCCKDHGSNCFSNQYYKFSALGAGSTLRDTVTLAETSDVL
ncbi:uncharacterized protein LOC143469218 [Clavelina lepadiformis]|uniref:uncharacterized protein LOC143469218 n=1 Tax=Clavelina lepadiformis TaxID=159417 RepID=UPI00404110FA